MTDRNRECVIRDGWCCAHHCYPKTCKELKFGKYAEEKK